MSILTEDAKRRDRERREALTALLAKIGYVPTVGLGS